MRLLLIGIGGISLFSIATGCNQKSSGVDSIKQGAVVTSNLTIDGFSSTNVIASTLPVPIDDFSSTNAIASTLPAPVTSSDTIETLALTPVSPLIEPTLIEPTLIELIELIEPTDPANPVSIPTSTTSVMINATASTTTTQVLIPPPAVGDKGILSSSGITKNGFIVSWAEATGTAPYQYTVYYSTSQNDVLSLESVATITNTTLSIQGSVVLADVTSATLSNLTPNTPYYVNVSVTDATGLTTLYAGGMFTTRHDLPPTLTSGTLTIPAGTLGTTAAALTWTAATPAVSMEPLQYQVYYSTSSTAVDSLANIQKGTDVIAFGTWTDSTTAMITGLNPNTPYYFNVVVQDSVTNQHNQLLYTMANATTSNQVYLFASGSTHKGTFGGRSGADQICTTAKNKNQATLGCNYVHAFLSVSASDYLTNFPTTFGDKNGNFPPTLAIVSPTNSPIANNWDNLTGSQLTGITGSFKDALGGTSSTFWTGGRTFASGNNCNSWASTSSSAQSGTIGYYNPIYSGKFSNSGGSAYCTDINDLICVCW